MQKGSALFRPMANELQMTSRCTFCAWMMTGALLWLLGLSVQPVHADGALPRPSPESVLQEIHRVAQLPGGQHVAALREAPVLMWSNQATVGIDNAYSNGTRFLAVRLIIVNQSDKPESLRREKLVLQSGNRTFPIGEMPRNIPLAIDDERVAQSSLRMPEAVDIPAGSAAEFWCLFPNVDSIAVTPSLMLRAEFDSGRRTELDLLRQQQARLGLSSERLGPSQALAVFRIHGSLNSLNSVPLTRAFENTIHQGTQRIVLDWNDDAAPLAERLRAWLATTNHQFDQDQQVALQLPVLPSVQFFAVSRAPVQEASGSYNYAREYGKNFDDPGSAVVAGLRELYERIDPELLTQELQFGHPWSRMAVCLTAADRLSPSNSRELLALSRDADPQLRMAALHALAFQNSESAQQRLNEAIANAASNQPDAQAAFQALLASQRREQRQIVADILQSDPLPIPRDWALRNIAENYHPDFNEFLIGSVSHAQPAVRRTALEVLFQLGHARLPELCLKALEDPDDEVRQSAFQILVESPGSQFEEAALSHALKQLQNENVEDSALVLIERLRATEAAPIIVERIKNSEPPRIRLITALESIGSHEDLQDLFAMFDDLQPDEQATALNLAGQLALPEQLKIAEKAMKSPEFSVRYVAIDLMKRLDDPRAVAILGERLPKAPENELNALCMSLGEMGTTAAINRLRNFRLEVIKQEQFEKLPVIERGFQIWNARRPGWSSVEDGYRHRAIEDDDTALKQFSLAIMINPELGAAFAGRGNLHYQHNRFEDAEKDFREAMRLDPFDNQAITGVALLETIRGNWEAGIEYVEERAEWYPEDPYFRYNSACVYGRAIEALQKEPATQENRDRIRQFEQEAIDLLQKAAQQGFQQFDWMREDPDLAPLRNLPAFQKIGVN